MNDVVVLVVTDPREGTSRIVPELVRNRAAASGGRIVGELTDEITGAQFTVAIFPADRVPIDLEQFVVRPISGS
jgi:hypothetical protein